MLVAAAELQDWRIESVGVEAKPLGGRRRGEALLVVESIHGFDVSPDLKVVAGGRLQGVPIMLIFCVALIVVAE